MSNVVHIYRELPPVDDNDSGGEQVIEVRYTISRYYPATGPDKRGPGEPAMGGEVEVLSALDADGNEVELTADEILNLPEYDE